MNIPKEVFTDRLVLRQVTEEYAEEVNALLDDEVTRYMYISPLPVEETYKWVREKQELAKQGTDWTFFIFDKKTGSLIGGGGLHKLDTDTPEFGIWIRKEAWGKGFGKETIGAAKKWVDDNVDYKYLVYPVDRKNIASRKIAEGIGGKIAKEFERTTPSGKVLDVVEYRVYKQ